jgi:hypothetical protein
LEILLSVSPYPITKNSHLEIIAILQCSGAEQQVTRSVEFRLAQLPLHPEQGTVHRVEAAAGRSYVEGRQPAFLRRQERGPGCLQICAGKSCGRFGRY